MPVRECGSRRARNLVLRQTRAELETLYRDREIRFRGTVLSIAVRLPRTCRGRAGDRSPLQLRRAGFYQKWSARIPDMRDGSYQRHEGLRIPSVAPVVLVLCDHRELYGFGDSLPFAIDVRHLSESSRLPARFGHLPLQEVHIGPTFRGTAPFVNLAGKVVCRRAGVAATAR